MQVNTGARGVRRAAQLLPQPTVRHTCVVNLPGDMDSPEEPTKAGAELSASPRRSNEYCTCGAKLPEDARFCHKCGKPQFELIEPEEPAVVEPVPPVPVQPPPQPQGVGFRNPAAVRVA